MSLLSVIESHKQRRHEKAAAISAARQRAEASLKHFNTELAIAVNEDVAKVYENERELEREARKLKEQSGRFAAQTRRWLDSYARLNRAFDELGDVEQWTKQVHGDLQTAVTALEYVAKEQAKAHGLVSLEEEEVERTGGSGAESASGKTASAAAAAAAAAAPASAGEGTTTLE